MTAIPAPFRVQVAVEPQLLRDVLRAQVSTDPRLVVVDELSEADVLVTTRDNGPLLLTRVADSAPVPNSGQLVAGILALLVREPRVVVLPEEPVRSADGLDLS